MLPHLLEGLHVEQKEAGKDGTTAEDTEIIGIVGAMVAISFADMK